MAESFSQMGPDSEYEEEEGKEPLKKFRQTPELMSLIFSKWRELYEEYGKTTTGEFQGALRYVLTEHLYQYTFQFVYSGHASD
tara:strand:- start:450 stop:698 length:249 start_codon:yes stop_codon:yes gene_type:complete